MYTPRLKKKKHDMNLQVLIVNDPVSIRAIFLVAWKRINAFPSGTQPYFSCLPHAQPNHTPIITSSYFTADILTLPQKGEIRILGER